MKKTTRIFAFILIVNLFATTAFSQVESKAKPPLMGWASWNNFGVNISESIIEKQAAAMVSSTLAAAGFKYINIDDGFFNGRYANGALRIDSIKFPKGMKSVADYIHLKGLKAGFYSDAGSNTCGSYANDQPGGVNVGLYLHDQQDIDSIFKNWGYDYIKVDYCGAQHLGLDEKTRYSAIKKAIENTGRTDIGYNVCRWQFPGVWVTSIADSWRISGDIWASWERIIDIINQNTFLASFASKGHYNDMDMLEVGRGMTAEEDKSHFSMWCILSSPLVLGNDLTTLSQQTKNTLTNAEVIAVDQDTTGTQAQLVSDNGAGLQVWAKNLNGKQSKERAVVLFNRSAVSASITLKLNDLNLEGPATCRNLWSHINLGNIDSVYKTNVPSHGVVMLKVIGAATKLKETFEAEYAWINNFNLTQNANVVANQGRAVTDYNCSGLAKAVSLGKRADNYIEFRDILAPSSDRYRITITYLCGDIRKATMSVNGIDTLLTGLYSGGNITLKSSSYTVKLKEGYNTIKFSNSTASLPDFDKIQINLRPIVNGAAPDGYTWCAEDNGSFTLPARCDVAYGANGMFNYMYGKTGTVTFNSATFGDPILNVAKAGYYKILPNCVATPVTPYLQVNNEAWQQISSVTINTGDKIAFGPQPVEGGTWSWSGLGTSGNSREQTITPASTGIATATFTNECGEKTIQNFNITVKGSTDIKDLKAEGLIKRIYPNPANNLVNIEVTSNKPIDISIFDETGRLVYSKSDVTANLKIPTNRIGKKGIYFVKTGQETQKLTIE